MFEVLDNNQEFSRRHIGPDEKETSEMLSSLGFSTLEEMASKVVPHNIRTKSNYEKLGAGISEFDLLARLRKMVSQNKVMKSYIGMGFHDTITPTVIQRNIFENPVWYTAYTPYQSEIAQGRMEALLNFQTVVSDLTGMEIANASLLDEGTAAAEAMVMAHSLAKSESEAFIASEHSHPHVLEVLKTRAEPLGIELIIADPIGHDYTAKPVFGALLAYPRTDGTIQDFREVTNQVHAQGGLVVADVDLLAMTMLAPPGEWGADFAVGNSQRFGVPLGFGGPHAAFIACKDAHKRSLPGRLIGISVDTDGKPALRLALQTREQHIRREKASSNICTAQVLLANMASMYAVYHGPHGLSIIAKRIHLYALTLASGLSQLGFEIASAPFFDTVKVTTAKAQSILSFAEKMGMNLRLLNEHTLTVSLNETTSLKDVEDLWTAFNMGANSTLNANELVRNVRNNWHQEMHRRTEFLTHPTFNKHHSETEMLRYIHALQNKDLTLTHSMIPLGSCTMKLNATTELVPVSWPEISRLHPFAPVNQAQGLIEMIKDLEALLCEITGFAAVSVQPNSGAQGEYAGLLVIRKYFQSKNQAHRNICLIPASAHGTNPASASLAGMKIVGVATDSQGNVDVTDLKAKALAHKDNLAALMITYPSTHGVFEESIVEICKTVHDCGGQVYMDGANLNALVGLARPGEFGPDVSHMNLHKTFAIPHGGGGPGVGPIGVASHLKDFLPTSSLRPEAGPPNGISAVTSAPWGSASILPISWSYIVMMGYEGLKRATLIAILNANYIAKKLAPHYPILYKGKEGLVAHECIIDLRDLKKFGLEVNDVAKRLMDYGFHSPTMSFPVTGTLMIEPTESENKEELDRFIEAMIQIKKEITDVESGKADKENNVLKNAPHTLKAVTSSEWNRPYSRETAAYPLPYLRENKFWPAVSRVDNAYGDKNIFCSCR